MYVVHEIVTNFAISFLSGVTHEGVRGQARIEIRRIRLIRPNRQGEAPSLLTVFIFGEVVSENLATFLANLLRLIPH